MLYDQRYKCLCISRMKKRNYTWEEFDKDCDKIAKRLKKTKFHAIYGVPRGGLMVAVKLSHLLDIPITLDIYNANLVVDEICDSGKTLLNLSKMPCIYKKRVFATIHIRDQKRDKKPLFIPDIYLHKTKFWIVYPWEI